MTIDIAGQKFIAALGGTTAFPLAARSCRRRQSQLPLPQQARNALPLSAHKRILKPIRS
jgi:hypothetical protein